MIKLIFFFLDVKGFILSSEAEALYGSAAAQLMLDITSAVG